MCYVDEGGDVATRRAELRDYGFECACERCVREAAGRQPRGSRVAGKRPELPLEPCVCTRGLSGTDTLSPISL